MVILGKDPKGETVFSNPATPDQHLGWLQSKANSELGNTTMQDKVAAYTEQVAKLEEEPKRTTEDTQ